jgi:type I restriction enzyme S subunit
MKNGTIVDDSIRYISPEVQQAIARYTINKEDLYITIAGTIGQVGRVPPIFDGHNLTENAAKLVFREIDRNYFLLALSSGPVQQQFRDKTKQMAQPKLALKRIAGASFLLPPLVTLRPRWQ